MTPCLVHLTPAERARLAEGWTKIALMEHASIAAFARFTLQLMSLGAPADLVERSNAAMADELAHAKLAFALASAYADRDVGPGLLDIRGACDGTSLSEILVTAIREGCVGETVAALEAAEALEYAIDPVVRRALAKIVQDETRHAELAWRFVQWAVELGGDELRQLAWQEFRAAGSDPPEEWSSRSLEKEELQLLEGGLVPDSLRQLVRTEAVARVVLVCARSLLGSSDLAAESSAA
jgi:hypothetical protein